jgi:hypothetical protein
VSFYWISFWWMPFWWMSIAFVMFNWKSFSWMLFFLFCIMNVLKVFNVLLINVIQLCGLLLNVNLLNVFVWIYEFFEMSFCWTLFFRMSFCWISLFRMPICWISFPRMPFYWAWIFRMRWMLFCWMSLMSFVSMLWHLLKRQITLTFLHDIKRERKTKKFLRSIFQL